MGDSTQGSIRKGQFSAVHSQQLFVLAHNAVFRLGQNTDQRFLVQRVQHRHNRQTTDQLRNQAKLDQIIRFHFAQQLLTGFLAVQVGAQLATKAEGALVGTGLDQLFQAVKGTAADEQDVLGVDLDEFLLRMFAAAVGRHIADSAFQNFQQCLLHALSANIAGDGWVLALAGDLINLVHIDNTNFGFGNIKVRSLNQLEQNVLNVLANVTGFGQGGGVRNRKRNVQHFGKRLGQQGFAGTGRAKHQYVGLLQLYMAFLPGKNALIMIVDRNCQHALGIVLTNDILVKASFDLSRRHDVDIRQRVNAGMPARSRSTAFRRCARRFGYVAILIQGTVAHINAIFADVYAGADDKLIHLALGTTAKAANHFTFSVLAGNRICHFLIPPVLVFYNDLIDQAIGLGFLCGQVVIAVSIFLHNLKRLAGILAEHAVHLFLDLHKVVGMDLDVACLAGKATSLAAGNQRLMDQDLRIRQGKTLTLGAAGQQKCTHGSSHAHADGGNIALDILHGIVDGHTVGNGTARAVDVEADIFFGVLPFQIQQLCNDHARGIGVDILAQNDNTVVQQAGENIIAALTARSLLNNIRYQAHSVPSLKQW